MVEFAKPLLKKLYESNFKIDAYITEVGWHEVSMSMRTNLQDAMNYIKQINDGMISRGWASPIKSSAYGKKMVGALEDALKPARGPSWKDRLLENYSTEWDQKKKAYDSAKKFTEIFVQFGGDLTNHLGIDRSEVDLPESEKDRIAREIAPEYGEEDLEGLDEENVEHDLIDQPTSDLEKLGKIRTKISEDIINYGMAPAGKIYKLYNTALNVLSASDASDEVTGPVQELVDRFRDINSRSPIDTRDSNWNLVDKAYSAISSYTKSID